MDRSSRKTSRLDVAAHCLSVALILGVALCVASCSGTGDSRPSDQGDAVAPRTTVRVSPPQTPPDPASTLERGLAWLLAHQEPDGRWSSSEFMTQCDRQERGEPCVALDLATASHPHGAGFAGYDVGVTSLAILAFVGAGHTHRDGENAAMRETVRRGCNWLLEQQLTNEDPSLDGLIGAPSSRANEWIYNHALASHALSELLFISRDRQRLAKPVEAATQWTLRAQNPGYGWKYGYQTGRNDTSVTSWLVLSLKTAKACADARLITIPKDELRASLDGALRWFRAVTPTTTGLVGYEAPGDEGSRLMASERDNTYPYSKEIPTLTAMANCSRLLAGVPRSDVGIRRGLTLVHGAPPAWVPPEGKQLSSVNQVYWYFGTYLSSLMTDENSAAWAAIAANTLIDHQRTDGCSRGSWDPIGEWGLAEGRVYSTALALLTLQKQDRSAKLERR